jgi:hypothetical protein
VKCSILLTTLMMYDCVYHFLRGQTWISPSQSSLNHKVESFSSFYKKKNAWHRIIVKCSHSYVTFTSYNNGLGYVPLFITILQIRKLRSHRWQMIELRSKPFSSECQSSSLCFLAQTSLMTNSQTVTE